MILHLCDKVHYIADASEFVQRRPFLLTILPTMVPTVAVAVEVGGWMYVGFDLDELRFSGGGHSLVGGKPPISLLCVSFVFR